MVKAPYSVLLKPVTEKTQALAASILTVAARYSFEKL
jgi:hypothetical protein